MIRRALSRPARHPAPELDAAGNAVMIQTIERQRCNALSTVPAGLAMFAGKLESVLRRIGPQIETIELGSAFMSMVRRALDLRRRPEPTRA